MLYIFSMMYLVYIVLFVGTIEHVYVVNMK